MKREIIAMFVLTVLCSGCADIKKPTIKSAMTHPWSTESGISIGMTKEEIKNRLGEPDVIRGAGHDELGSIKEEWIYNSRFSKVPVDYRNLAKTKYLYFSGNNLADMKNEEDVEKEAKQ